MQTLPTSENSHVYISAANPKPEGKHKRATSSKVYVLRDENRFKLAADFVADYVGQQPNWGYGLLSYATYKRTYARPVTEKQLIEEHVRYLGVSVETATETVKASKQASEEYWQTCVRVVEGASSILKQHVKDTGQPWSDAKEQVHAQEMFRRIWSMKFTPPGRGFWGMGTAALEEKGSGILNNCGFVSTEGITENFAEPFCALMDYSMLGVGMGFDLLGAGLRTLQAPAQSAEAYQVPDTREGWINCVRIMLNAYVGVGELPQGWDVSKVRREGAPLRTFGGTASGPGPLLDLLQSLQGICEQYVGRPISSTFIVDVMNLIGRCVVAGNVRRSSEIALGSATDPEFLKIKDNSEVFALYAMMDEIADRLPSVRAAKKKIAKLAKSRDDAGLSVLSSEFAAIQNKIDKLMARMKRDLKRDPDYSSVSEQVARHPMNSHRWASNNSVLPVVGETDYAPLAQQTAMNGEPGYVWLDVMRAYGRTGDAPNYKDRRVKGCNPCGEQSLEDFELCCLVECYPTRHENLDDFLETLKYAYRYAKAVTLVPTHNKRTNAVMVRNRRIGTSIAGIIEMYCKLGMTECKRWWNTGYKTICDWDTEYSSWLGVNESIKKTSVKPGGSVPLLTGVEGGMKPPSSRYYMRTVRMGHQAPLVSALAKAGYRVEKDRTTPRTSVVYFPCKAPDNVRTADEISLWEQAALLTALQETWSDNMVSCTLTFQPHEARDIANVLKVYEGKWKTVSFLPLSNHGFLQAPYIPCTKEEYEYAMTQLSPVELDGVIIAHDSEEKFCSGALCEISTGSQKAD